MKKKIRTYPSFVKNSLGKLLQASFDKRNRKHLYGSLIVVFFLIICCLYSADQQLMHDYQTLESVTILDRNGTVLTQFPNAKDAYALYSTTTPLRVAELLVKKEDRYFYFHPGINPLSTARALYQYISGHQVGGASTISQQLVKNLLGNEQNRTLANKFVELMYTFSLELFTSKREILTMYANTVFMGNQIQGLSGASTLYFNKRLEDLDDTKLAMLLATLSSPSTQNPWREENATVSRNLARRVGITFDPTKAVVTPIHIYVPPQNFELASMHEECAQTCVTTLDSELTNSLRKILNQYILQDWGAGARSGAIVVIKLPEVELLSIVGTPNAASSEPGQQINMAIQPRPIGSTAKPFIYLEGFAHGLRPYTLVDDREYKFPIGSGYPLYPKNYDGLYHGWITLHSALSNSYNVPTVKTLQYLGFANFYDFLQHSLGFRPLKDLDTYQYGIALGALEMDPLTLAHYLTLFPEEGTLKPLRLFINGTSTQYIETPMSDMATGQQVAKPALTELVSRVLNDRFTGVQQFGLASSLNLSESNYAVKTGTSQNYHDSWTVGYTPDFLVAVWIGNPENVPLKHVTGQSGAGAVWHDTMELLMNSSYNAHTPLSFALTSDVMVDGNLDFGLPGDVVGEHRNLLPDGYLITSPHDGDIFIQSSNITVPLVSQVSAAWYINGEYVGQSSDTSFSPNKLGEYDIRATGTDGTRGHIKIHVISQP